MSSPMKYCSSKSITSTFGHRKFIWPGNGNCGGDWYCDFHPAVDISSQGICDINAVLDGSLYSIGGYGLGLEINHGGGIYSRYGHGEYFIGSIPRHAKQDELIMNEGSTGFSQAPHLHFELIINGSQVDPLLYINPI